MSGLPFVGDQFAGYRLQSVLGRGGMSGCPVPDKSARGCGSELAGPVWLAMGLASCRRKLNTDPCVATEI